MKLEQIGMICKWKKESNKQMKPIIFTDDHKATVAQKTDPMFVYF
jgi:hypothetical protein